MRCDCVHTDFVNRLVAKGWKPQPDRGQHWWPVRLRKALRFPAQRGLQRIRYQVACVLVLLLSPELMSSGPCGPRID